MEKHMVLFNIFNVYNIQFPKIFYEIIDNVLKSQEHLSAILNPTFHAICDDGNRCKIQLVKYLQPR